MKKLLAIILSLTMIIGLYACSNTEKNIENLNTEITNDIESNEMLEDNNIPKWVKSRFIFNGEKLTIPFNASELIKQGYESCDYDSSKTTLYYNEISDNLYWENKNEVEKNYSIIAYVANNNEKETLIKDCDVCRIEIAMYPWASVDSSLPSFILNKDISFGCSKEDVIKAYGNPTNETMDTDTLVYTYDSCEDISSIANSVIYFYNDYEYVMEFRFDERGLYKIGLGSTKGFKSWDKQRVIEQNK